MYTSDVGDKSLACVMICVAVRKQILHHQLSDPCNYRSSAKVIFTTATELPLGVMRVEGRRRRENCGGRQSITSPER
jgi:hypothetical protein